MTGSVAASLELAYLQSYGKDVRVETLTGGADPPRWAGPRMRLPRDAALAFTTVTPAVPGRPAAAAGPPWPGWAAALVGAFGPQRFELRHPYRTALRAFPSPRAAFPTTVFVATPASVSVYDPVDQALVRVSGACFPSLTEPVRLLCGSYVAALSPGYGPMREALALLEAGHAAATIQEICAAFGVPAAIDLEPRPCPRDEPLLRAFAVDLPGAAPAHPRPATVHSGPTLASVLMRRSSGHAWGGLTGKAAPMPAEVFARAVAALDAASIDTALPLRPRVLVALERVDGIADGLYEPGGGKLVAVREGTLLRAVQAAYRYPASSTVTIDSLHAVWCFVVDYPAQLARRGRQGFRECQLVLGAYAQRLGLALARDNYFARPVRAFDEETLDAVLGLAATEQVGYAVLTGRSTFTDLTIDLRT